MGQVMQPEMQAEVLREMILRNKVEAIAAATHMANRAYCLALGDASQSVWSEAPDWQKESAKAGVVAAIDPEQTPERSHEQWMARKEAEGWVYGDVKDEEKKRHPCMVPYVELPESQRRKDELFVATAREMAKVLGVEAKK